MKEFAVMVWENTEHTQWRDSPGVKMVSVYLDKAYKNEEVMREEFMQTSTVYIEGNFYSLVDFIISNYLSSLLVLIISKYSEQRNLELLEEFENEYGEIVDEYPVSNYGSMDWSLLKNKSSIPTAWTK